MDQMVDLLVAVLTSFWLWIVVALFLMFLTFIAVVKSRYKVFPPNVFVIHIRRGEVKRKSFGGAFFRLPIVDQYFTLPTTIQRIEIKASDKVISRENQEIIVRGFLVWRVEDAEKAFRRITGVTSGNTLREIDTTLEQLAESVIRTTVANMSLDEILRNRGKIVDELMKEFAQVVSTWGISIETVEVKDVELLNQELFLNLQAEFENKKALEAQEIQIQTSEMVERANIAKQRELAKAKAEADRETRMIQAEQDEVARIRELEKERRIIEQEKEVQLTRANQEKEVQTAQELREQEVGLAERRKNVEFTEQDRLLEIAREQKEMEVGVARKKKEHELLEQERLLAIKRKQKELEVMQADRQREVEEADYFQKETSIRAETELIRRTKEAEAEKMRTIKTQVEVEAERRRLDAQAEAEAARVRSEGQADARRTEAQSESDRIKWLADARREEMLAEAEGIRAKLEAEAEGLERQVLAQNQVAPHVLSRQVIQEVVSSLAEVLPQIAEKMQVGDVRWVNLGGDSNGSNPLGIIPKNLVQLVTTMQAFGVDIPGLLNGLIADTTGGESGGSGGNGSPKPLELSALSSLLTSGGKRKSTKKRQDETFPSSSDMAGEAPA